jgi:ubiquinone biosynthesis monooxygenase Coq7
MNGYTHQANKQRLRRAASTAEKMIKVDHAGENGAVNIYRAQRLAASLRAPSLRPQLLDFQKHEEEHRRIFQTHLSEIGVRRCVSFHACGLGGFTLGLVTGIIGPSAIAATTYAVEHVVLTHLQEQMEFLKSDNQRAYDCVAQIYEDERSHHDTAASQIETHGPLTRILIAIVQASTELVIRFGMR